MPPVRSSSLFPSRESNATGGSSFVRAAERLDLSVSAVSRHVADLEDHLGVRLLNRTTRRLSLTQAGTSFHERSVQLLASSLVRATTVLGLKHSLTTVVGLHSNTEQGGLAGKCSNANTVVARTRELASSCTLRVSA